MAIPITQAVTALARESRAYFREIEAGLAQWQAEPGNAALLGQARKRLRSIGGAAGLLGLEGLAEVARRFSQVLEAAAPGGVTDRRAPTSVRPLVQCARLMEGHLEEVAQGHIGEARLNAAQGQLQLWMGMLEHGEGHSAHLSGQFVEVFREEAWTHLGWITKGLRELKRAGWRAERLEAARNALHTLKGAAGVIGLYEASAVAHELEDLMDEAQQLREGGTDLGAGTHECLHEVFGQLARCCGVPAKAKLMGAVAEDIEEVGPEEPLAGELQVRLPWRAIDELGWLASELAAAAEEKGAGHPGPLQTEMGGLVDAISRLRRAPFSMLEDRLRRTVAGAARRLGKDAVLEFDGGAADIDRGLMEEITAPLEHLLRNAVDHGLEDAALRVAAGKPAAGRIRVLSYTQGDQLIVEVTDDGGGVNTARLRHKAVENGILSLEDVLELSDAEATNLVFAAGLSTSAQVSELSGRGVGLAIVKKMVDQLGGSKAVESRPGLGTTFRLILPMAAGEPAAVRVLEAGTSSGVYGVPATAVVRVLRLAQGRVEWDCGQRYLALGSERFPALMMDQVFGAADSGTEPEAHWPVLLLKASGRRVAWIVDRIGGMPEVTLRPLSGVQSVLGALPGINSVVLSGDEVTLVLDVEQVVASAWSAAVRASLTSTRVSLAVHGSNSYWESKAS